MLPCFISDTYLLMPTFICCIPACQVANTSVCVAWKTAIGKLHLSVLLDGLLLQTLRCSLMQSPSRSITSIAGLPLFLKHRFIDSCWYNSLRAHALDVCVFCNWFCVRDYSEVIVVLRNHMHLSAGAGDYGEHVLEMCIKYFQSSRGSRQTDGSNHSCTIFSYFRACFLNLLLLLANA